MLQRAASNAYSWWWASHIRTKQSKWLEQALQDMEEKVQSMLSLIEGEGDSFVKRAEMFYRSRPELIATVEEAYKSFRSLADRYDMLSKELQNANTTIAAAFPDQVQFGALDVDDDDFTHLPPPPPPGGGVALPVQQNIPQAPQRDLKRLMSAAKQSPVKTAAAPLPLPRLPSRVRIEEKSGLTKEEAKDEISRLQKEILALQTVKEFAKSSYESGIAKYREIEGRMATMQQRVSKLQDEFDIGGIIEDDEARALMAEAALKSCNETLTLLKDRQDKVHGEALEEYKRMEAACQRLQAIRDKYLLDQGENPIKNMHAKLDKGSGGGMQEAKTIEVPLETTKGEAVSITDLSLRNMTVSQMAEKIDELVSKVIKLEAAVSSQTVLVGSLRSENDDLTKQIRTLEDDKATQVSNSDNLRLRVQKVEEKLNKIQDMNKNVETQHNHLESSFTEARESLDHLSVRLSSVEQDEEADDSSDNEVSPSQDKPKDDLPSMPHVNGAGGCKDDAKVVDMPEPEQAKREIRKSVSLLLDRKPRERIVKPCLNPDEHDDGEAPENTEKGKELNWHEMLLSGMEDHEKVLLKEYSSLLRNYNEIKQKVNRMEKKEKDDQFDLTLQISELKKAIAKKEEENHQLKKRLDSLKGKEDSHPAEEANNSNGEAKVIFVDRLPSQPNIEEKIQADIDAIQDESLSFWLRFSSVIHEAEKFRTEVQDLQDEALKLKEKRKSEGAFTSQIKSDAKAIYKHMKEIQRELLVWLDQSASLKDEIKSRFASMCSIQEEITKALKECADENEPQFSGHQAAKFQGEVVNMKQENSKVEEELHAALDIVRILQIDISKTLSQVNEEFSIENEQQEQSARPRVPLRAFLFGGNKKKTKSSFFALMHPHRRSPVVKGGTHTLNH